MGDPLGYVIRQRDPFTFGLRTKDRDPGFEVGLVDLGDQALEETTSESLLESRQVAW